MSNHEAVTAEAVAQERERCAAIADDEARIREEAGKKHVDGSLARDRCFAGARAAANVAKGIRNGEQVDAVPAAERVLPHPIGKIFSDGYWNLNVMLRDRAEVDPYRRFHGGVDVYTADQVRELLRSPGGAQPLKDHQIAQTVNALATIAREYGQTQQLRARIAQILVPLLKGQGFPRSIVSAYAMPAPICGKCGDAGVSAVAPAEPDAWVPIHPRNGPLWAMTTDKPNDERLPSYPLRPVVFADGARGTDAG